MLRHILFDVEFFADESERKNSQKRVLCLLEALVWCNRLYLQSHPDAPLIYKSGIEYKVPAQYEKENLPEIDVVRQFLLDKNAPVSVIAAFNAMANQLGAGEHFREIPRIIENGGGDCDNVAAWRVAELREHGIAAKPYITWRRRQDGGMTYHVIVLWPDGTSEDPSLLLGMGGAARAAEREEEVRKLGERAGDFLSGLAVRAKRNKSEIFGAGAITSAQDFSQLQYTIPFQTDDSYESWSPTRPQGFYANPLYPSLPSAPGGGPIFNTRMRDPDEMDYKFEEREDSLDGAGRSYLRKLGRRARQLAGKRKSA